MCMGPWFTRASHVSPWLLLHAVTLYGYYCMLCMLVLGLLGTHMWVFGCHCIYESVYTRDSHMGVHATRNSLFVIPLFISYVFVLLNQNFHDFHGKLKINGLCCNASLFFQRATE